MDEYSVLKPPTNSCSASTKSNGGRLSSAVAEMKKMTNGTKPVATTFHVPNVPCALTMPLVDNVPVTRNTVANDMPSDAS